MNIAKDKTKPKDVAEKTIEDIAKATKTDDEYAKKHIIVKVFDL